MKTKYSNVFVNPTPDEIEGNDNIIAFDLDSVLNSGCNEAIRNKFCDKFDVTEYDIIDTDPTFGHRVFSIKIPGIPDKIIYPAITEAVIEESPSLLPTPFMAETLRFVYEVTGMPITVVTSRNASCVDVTHNWLKENLEGTPFVAYVMHGVYKSRVLDCMNASIFIDDRWKTINNLISWIEYPVMFKQPWNEGRIQKLPVLSVRDLRDIIPLVNIKLGRVPMDWPSNVPFPKREWEK